MADRVDTVESENARERIESDEERDLRFSGLGRLAATMAHEFNNVLMGIQPFIDLIAHREVSATQKEKALKHIALSIQRGKQITAEVLRIARPTTPMLRSIGVSPWLRSMEMDLQAMLPKNVSLGVEIEDGPDPLHIECDVNQMNQVLTNLVANARDAMPHGGSIVVRADRCYSWMTLPACIDSPDRFVRFIVEDNGYGMNQVTLGRIFEPLFTTKRNGTGLGLAVVRQIVERHGGFVTVDSTPGRGTKFQLFLPSALPPDYDHCGIEPERPRTWNSDLRLLIVEDDRNVSTAMADTLRQLGLHVDVIHTGGRAAEAVRRFRPDIVVLDVGLPDMSGSDVFWILRKDFPRLPIVFSTGHADKMALGSALTQPRVAFLVKPYSTDTLFDAITEVIEVQ